MRLLLFLGLIVSSDIAYADWLADIAAGIAHSNVLTGAILDISRSSLDIQIQNLALQKELLNSDLRTENLLSQVNTNLTGHSGWGNYGFHDYQSYGGSAANWSNVLAMAGSGQGSGQLGNFVNSLSNQFPINTYDFNHGVSQPELQKYYQVKSETILATRAASQLDYDKIQQQIAYQQMLQQQIEKTKDVKAAMDLSNRIQVEGNLISLEVLRQAALSNQQQAVYEQSDVNTSLANARFLSK